MVNAQPGSPEKYTPGPVPGAYDADYLRRELARVSSILSQIIDGQRAILHVPPPRPFEGLTVLADGTNWNPGSGAGEYRFQGGVWVFVG